MRIVLLCATRRGYLFLQKLAELLPKSELIVFSFQETPWEPLFMEDIRELTRVKGGRFIKARQVGNERWRQFWESDSIDLMFVVSWRYMIPSKIYQRPRLGTFVFHDSLLPKYRGFSPTVWAIINGEEHTGVTLFEIDEEVDAGDIVDQKKVPIKPEDNISNVMERVTQTYLELLEHNLEGLVEGTAELRSQDHSKATYTCKRIPQDNRIDWSESSENIYNLIRAVSTPYPGAFTQLSGKKIYIWSAHRLDDTPLYVGRIPGRVVEVRPGEGVVVLTGDGSLLVNKIQLEGKQVVCASKILDSLAHTLGS